MDVNLAVPLELCVRVVRWEEDVDGYLSRNVGAIQNCLEISFSCFRIIGWDVCIRLQAIRRPITTQKDFVNPTLFTHDLSRVKGW